MTTTTPVYDDAYYRDYDGQRYERNETWLGVFRHFAKQIVTSLRPARTLDAGCAIGLLVEALDELGVESYGVDISQSAIDRVPEHLAKRCWVGSLTDPITEHYDLVTCIEVIEHLPATEAPLAIANLCSATDTVLLSSTPLEHEEPTHLNVQPPEYWSALFATNGFFRDTDYDASFISPWAALYRRRDLDTAELVRSYDRSWWRLRDENQRVRQALMDTTAQKQILDSVLTDEELDSVTSSPDPTARYRELAQRIIDDRGIDDASSTGRSRRAEEEQKMLLLRDELIGEQRRAGELAGRVAELEAELAAYQPLRTRYAEIEAQYQEVIGSTTWRVAWKLLAPYRKLRGRTEDPAVD